MMKPINNTTDKYIEMFYNSLTQFIQEIQLNHTKKTPMYGSLKRYLQKIKTSFESTNDSFKLTVIKPNVKILQRHSKDILFRNGCVFVSPILLFDNMFDISRFWKAQTSEGKKSVWEYIEQFYIIGNIILYPERAEKFIKTVSVLKQRHTSDMSKSADENIDEHVVSPEDPTENEDQAFSIDKLCKEFAGDDEFMSELFSDISSEVNKIASQNDTATLMNKIKNQDLSMFTNIMNRVSEKIDSRIENGELDDQTIKNQASQLQNQLQQMTQQLGIPLNSFLNPDILKQMQQR